MVSDRGTGAPYDSIGPIALSWNGSRSGYVGHSWDRTIVVIDGVESPWCDEATTPLFDLASHHVAYARRNGSSWKVILYGKESESFVQVDLASLRFSANGTKLGYVASIGAMKAFFVNGEPGALWPAIVADSSCFSRDGTHTLYWAGQSLSAMRVVWDGKPREMREAECPGPFAISAVGNHIAYSECTTGRSGFHVVHDSMAGPQFDRVNQLRLSRDGERVAYTAQIGDYQAAVVDGRAGPSFAIVGESSFSADGRHEAHVGQIAPGRQVVVFDGRNGPEFEWIAPRRPTLLPDGTLQYLAVRKSELLRITRVPRAGE